MRTGLAIQTPSLPYLFAATPDITRVCELRTEDEFEVLEFLAIRPVHTVVMTSFILDNGIESSLNRGTFYGYRGWTGELQAVALIGHSTLIEARSEEALQAMADVARTTRIPIHLIMSGGDVATSFWNYLYGPTRVPSRVCTELLFEASFPFTVQNAGRDLRLAHPDELEPIAVAHAEVAELECGIDPMTRDPEGFRKRVLRRIEQERVFVVFDDDKLVFKADIIAESDSVAYIEGVYVSPEYRGRGIASKCLSELCRRLLGRVDSVCLLSNVEFQNAHRCFLKAGMRNTDACTTLFA